MTAHAADDFQLYDAHWRSQTLDIIDSFDLLGAQVAARRKRKIQILAYYMTTLNPQLARQHPEWLAVPRPPASLVCPQNQGTFYGLAQRAPLFDYSSQEALFTDAPHYGYNC